MVFKRRNRLISFRLSEEEYAILHDLCVTEGARSVSDYARSALSQVMMANGAGRTSRSEEKPANQNLIDSMERLSQVIARLSRLMEGAPPNGAGHRQAASDKIQINT